jgi:CRISPR-associated protein Csd1
MILQALNDYYLRRQADPDPARRLAAFGLESKDIAFILELDLSGRLTSVADVRRPVGNRLVGTPFLVPQATKKTSGVAANLLWDNAEYVLAMPDPAKLEAAERKGTAREYAQRLALMQAAFRNRIASLPESALADNGVVAVLRFLESDALAQLQGFAAVADIAATNPLLTFRLVGDDGLVCARVAGVAAGDSEAEDDQPHRNAGAGAVQYACLISGETAPAERLHSSIKGVWGAQSSGANVVSFNLDAFRSYGKEQGNNAPVSRAAAFAYTTALNALLARGSTQRCQVGDASTVFWAQRSGEPLEPWLAEIVGGSDDPDAHAQQVKALLDAVRTGGVDGERGANLFYVLGLAPNAARISVRFWHAAPLREIGGRLATWFDDLRIVRGPADKPFPGLAALLESVAVLGKAENVPPRLGGDLVRAVFSGAPFPASWLGAAVQRCRIERDVGYLRAASIKAALTRAARFSSAGPIPRHLEITEVLNIENPSQAYRLGRLFATLERIQEEASPGLNSTIRERYYAAASSTPVAVFTTLLRLKNHHLAKLQNRGRAVNLEKLLGEIMDGISELPAHLSLSDQGRFAIGYYHQRQGFFVSRDPAAA